MSKETINSIKNLVLTLSDRAIGKRLNLSKDQVYRLRKKYKIFRVPNQKASTSPVLNELEKAAIKAFKFTKKKLIFTSWEIRVRPDKRFINILINIAKDQDAELICSVIAPEDVRFIPKIIKDNFKIVNSSFSINDNLQFEYVPTHALVTVPTQNFKSFSQKSTIIPALLRDMQTLPSIRLPKMVTTTGSIGRLSAFSADYDFIDDEEDQRLFNKRWSQISNRRGGIIYATAKNFIEPSALIINIKNDKYFHARYISMPKDRVYDLDKVYFEDGKISKNIPEALVLGDLHEWNKDSIEYKKSLELIKYFEPKKVFLNDFFDGCSISHHDIHKAVSNIRLPDLDTEAESARNTLLEICNISKQVMYLQSNHCNFVNKWLDDESAWRYNRNYVTALELQLYRIKENKHPIIKLLELDKINNLTFVEENARYFLNQTLYEHGHCGINGKRVGFYELAKLYNHYICGHFHSARMYRNAMQVGKVIRSDVDYASTGASSWICADGIVHADDSKQLLFIIEGISILDYLD